MKKYSSYCEYASSLSLDNVHRIYHDTQYGFPIKSDNELFGRLILEINQAGLSWTTILKKQENFRKAFFDFDIKRIANLNEKNIYLLLSNPGIIRNRLKIYAVIYNANKIIQMNKEYGSFKSWLDHHYPKEIEEWVKLFKRIFKFTGEEIIKEFLISSGYLKGAHVSSCPISKVIQEL
ncbi:MAG: DNA-3-methyladenine glycosylase I [Flavobacteriaceae bacterium]|nr:DNA-3-methyladenine glycosylase I [Flavobacteriaceae bacterium]